MKFDPTKPLELNLLGCPAMPDDFIEQTETITAPRPGWAPPRRRPRRIYKKLDRRGFLLHHTPDAVYFDDKQNRLVRRTAPDLAAWLSTPKEGPLLVKFQPLMTDGDGPPKTAPREFWGAERLEFIEAEPIVLDSRDLPMLSRRIVWGGKVVRMGVLVTSRRTLASSKLEASLVVYTPGADVPLDIKRAFTTALHRLHMAMLTAEMGLSSTKIIARHTCYRPTD